MTSIAIFRIISRFSDFSSHKIQCLNGNNFETTNPISILFMNLLTYFTQRFQKCKVPFYDRGTFIFEIAKLVRGYNNYIMFFIPLF